MSDVVIRAEGLSKCYQIGPAQEPYGSLRESLMRTLRSPLGRRRDKDDTIWALKDVSFEIERGEVVGIIGRNGAGKSTLLKILSRITKPTEGQVVIRGRVGSLLEVGTGFHPELTGRENVYLNGAILGMRRHEIDRRFDEIVDFAEIEKFLDTPVKRYSSGMYVRLAFAVAAHLEPEILLVDEVLAVGDWSFRKKSLQKMEDVSITGRSVLFVSHNMSNISKLAQKTIILNAGNLTFYGETNAAIKHFTGLRGHESTAIYRPEEKSHALEDLVFIGSVRILDEHGEVQEEFGTMQKILIEINYCVTASVRFNAVIDLRNSSGVRILVSADNNTQVSTGDEPRASGNYTSICHFPPILLNEGTYFVRVTIADLNRKYKYADIFDAVSFTIRETLDELNPVSQGYGSNWPGVIKPILEWDTESEPR